MVLAIAAGCDASTAFDATPTQNQVTQYTYEVVERYPHAAVAYTQGLVYQDGLLYEGTGGYGRSWLQRVELATGTARSGRVSLPDEYFGEGIALWEDRIFQLTWKRQTAFVYDRVTLTQVEQLPYQGEGWGLTHDGRRLILSDGTPTLKFIDPNGFRVTGSVQIREAGVPVRYLNELEYIDGEVYANVWLTDRIVRIDPATGNVIGSIDLTGLRPTVTLADDNAVLNGIAYDPDGKRLFVTGKNWPFLYHIRLVPL